MVSDHERDSDESTLSRRAARLTGVALKVSATATELEGGLQRYLADACLRSREGEPLRAGESIGIGDLPPILPLIFFDILNLPKRQQDSFVDTMQNLPTLAIEVSVGIHIGPMGSDAGPIDNPR